MIQQQHDGRMFLFGFPQIIQEAVVGEFFDQWVRHKKKVQSHWELKYGTILLVCETESYPLGGCAVDELYRWAKEQGWVRDRMFFLDEKGLLQSVLWESISQSFCTRQITEETRILNLSVYKTSDWKKNPSFLQLFKDSWYARFALQSV